MAKDTITLVLNGDISLTDYVKAVIEFQNLVDALSGDYAPGKKIVWDIDELESGSARNTIRGKPEIDEEIPVVEKVVNAFEKVSEDTYKGDISQYSKNVQSAINGITDVINGKISSVRFETNEIEWEISKQLTNKSDKEIEEEIHSLHFLETFGAVKGRIQSLTREKQHKFTIYDINEHRAITCYLTPDFEDEMRESWGKIAVVEGVVRRDPETGKPTSVRKVKTITILPESTKGGWRKALGCAPEYTGGLSSEDAIRKLRDD